MLALSIEPTQNQNSVNLNEGSYSKSLSGLSGNNSDSSAFAKILSSLSESKNRKLDDTAKIKDGAKKANLEKSKTNSREKVKDVDSDAASLHAGAGGVEKSEASKNAAQDEKNAKDVNGSETKEKVSETSKTDSVKENALSEFYATTKTDPFALSEEELLNASNFENIDLSVTDAQAELLSENISFEELMAASQNAAGENLSSELVLSQNESYDNPKQFLDSLKEKLNAENVEGVESELTFTSDDLAELSVDEMLPVQDEKVFSVIDQRQNLDEVDFSSTEDIEVTVNSETADTMNVTYSLNAMSQQNILSNNSQSASASSSNYQQMLTNQVTSNVPDFVKAGQIVLRDNNNGTINLNLKPEALGNVKISLELSDKVITGQITVHSKEAFEAFKDNLEVLKQAFQQSGFENAELTLNLSQNGNQGFFGQNGQEQSSEPFMASKSYGDYASSEVSESSAGQANYESSSNFQVDVVA